ncbi:Enterochelin esterase [Thermomonospora echinospora]|uniref:Enterochelin esterase n=1 Tax=Thermomonospora echinospora TaxID=1992 RepID=A0A1H6CVF9_9ACTN|nr:Enterochelin esterase [Thermomonospora echinospora]
MLTDGDRVEPVPARYEAADLDRRLSGGHQVAFADGEILTLACRGTDAVAHVFDLEIPMVPVGAAGLLALSLRVPRLEEAIVSFHCEAEPAPDRPPGYGLWRGPKAPPPVRRAPVTLAQVRTVPLRSAALGGPRTLRVYHPPIPPGAPRRVLFGTDGEAWEQVVEPLIRDGALPAIIAIGVENGGPARLREYVAGIDRVRFAAHRRFFAREVVGWAERELGISPDPAHRAVAGVSNGADFAAAIGVLEPGRFGGVIALSCGRIDPRRVPPGRGGARQWLAAGTLEPGFRKVTGRWADALERAGVEHVHRVRVAAHDPAMWGQEVAAALPWIFR